MQDQRQPSAEELDALTARLQEHGKNVRANQDSAEAKEENERSRSDCYKLSFKLRLPRNTLRIAGEEGPREPGGESEGMGHGKATDEPWADVESDGDGSRQGSAAFGGPCVGAASRAAAAHASKPSANRGADAWGKYSKREAKRARASHAAISFYFPQSELLLDDEEAKAVAARAFEAGFF